jgi:regulatory protein YycI of two-component signal transduction system YycFG
MNNYILLGILIIVFILAYLVLCEIYFNWQHRNKWNAFINEMESKTNNKTEILL